MWSITRGVANGIRLGTVKVWGVDPKGGMELSFGRGLFDRLACENPADMLAVLEDGVAWMQRRQRFSAGITRMHQPTVEDPFVLVLVDELAALSAYGDHKMRARTAAALQMLTSQGRAPGSVSSRRCRTRARRSCRSGTCSPPGSGSG